MNLLPKDEKFFDLFHQHVQMLCRASALLVTGLKAGYQGMSDIAKEMEAIERAGDEVIHEIFHRLQSTFLTPFDPEDIQTLATATDDVLDAIEDATFRIVAYRLDPIPEPAVRLGQLIEEACQSLARAIESLRYRRPCLEHCVEVNRIENQADAIERTQIARLFGCEMDALSLIKHKEIYELLESATDRCEDVADVLQNVAIKNL
jgi:predicted phosphate transport protein (TIGR00153 family)